MTTSINENEITSTGEITSSIGMIALRREITTLNGGTITSNAKLPSNGMITLKNESITPKSKLITFSQ